MKLDYMLDHMPDTIRQQTIRRTFQPGEIVVRKGDKADHVYLLMAGKLRVSNEFESGQRYTFASLEVPDLMGDLEVLAGQEQFAATNEAITECQVLSMSAETFMHWMRVDNDFAVAVAQLLASKMYPTSNEAGRVKFQPGALKVIGQGVEIFAVFGRVCYRHNYNVPGAAARVAAIGYVWHGANSCL